jgi:hypothetical protein
MTLAAARSAQRAPPVSRDELRAINGTGHRIG